jgi:hypothetical protein
LTGSGGTKFDEGNHFSHTLNSSSNFYVADWFNLNLTVAVLFLIAALLKYNT